MPPPSDHATHRPRPRPPPPACESSVPAPAAKRRPASPPPAPAAAAKKIAARPASASDLTALPAARPRPRPIPRPPSTSAAKSGTGEPAFMAPRGAQTVRPARRLPPGTAVYVRTTFRPRNVNIRCRIQLWLRARVVSSPDAYHCTVKYAADLSDMFAGKIVSKPADHVRLAPRSTPTKPKPVAPALGAKEALPLPRR